MSTPSTKIPTQAEIFMKERAVALAEEAKPGILQGMEQQFAQSITPVPFDPKLVDLMQKFSTDPRAKEEFGARVLLSQLSQGFQHMFATQAKAQDMMAAGGILTHTITIDRTADERYQEDQRNFPELAARYFTPEIKSKLKDTQTTLELYTFDDQSVVVLNKVDPQASKTIQGLLHEAQNFSDLVGPNPQSRASRLADGFLQMSYDIRQQLEQKLKQLSKSKLKELIEEFSFESIKGVLSQSSIVYPVRDANVLVGHFIEQWDEEDGWKAGIGVKVNGTLVAHPSDLPLALGVAPLTSAMDLLMPFINQAATQLADRQAQKNALDAKNGAKVEKAGSSTKKVTKAVSEVNVIKKTAIKKKASSASVTKADTPVDAKASSADPESSNDAQEAPAPIKRARKPKP